MYQQQEYNDFDIISLDECSQETALEAQKESFRNEYSKTMLQEVLATQFEDTKFKGPVFFQDKTTLIFNPCSDNPAISKNQSIRDALNATTIPEGVNTLIFPVTEEQETVGTGILGFISKIPIISMLNPYRNHWVTLHYDMVAGKATLIDSRKELWYNTDYLEESLKEGLKNRGLNLNAFKVIYQGIQDDYIHCGPWTVKNILQLTSGALPDQIEHNKDSINEIVEQYIEALFPDESLENESIYSETLSDATLFPSVSGNEDEVIEDHRTLFNKLMRDINTFNETLSPENQNYINTMKDAISLKANAFFDANAENKPRLFNEFKAECNLQCQQVNEVLKHQSGMKMFFAGLTGLIMGIAATVCTLGYAAYYFSKNESFQKKYINTFFKSESSDIQDMRAKWQSEDNPVCRLFKEDGLLHQIEESLTPNSANP
jgi:hypothetical protein